MSSSAISMRRSARLPRLIRMPSKSAHYQSGGDSTTSYSYSDGSSCPNSPAVKKAYRLVVVGSVRTGKTALVSRFLEKEFEERYLPTIENFHRKLYKIRGDVYQLDVLDRAGNDLFPAARKLSYMTGDIFLIVGAVDHAQSVEQMLEIYQQIIECKTSASTIASRHILGSSGAPSSAPPFIGTSGGSGGGGCGFGSGSPNLSTTAPPIVFVLNKTDLPAHKWQVDVDEVRALIAAELFRHRRPNKQHHSSPRAAAASASSSNKDVLSLVDAHFVACSAARNENVIGAFARLFTLGRLPKCMNPELMHKLLKNEASADGALVAASSASSVVVGGGAGKKPVLQRMRSRFSRENEDEVVLDVNARRPSLRTEMLIYRARNTAATTAAPAYAIQQQDQQNIFSNANGSLVTAVTSSSPQQKSITAAVATSRTANTTNTAYTTAKSHCGGENGTAINGNGGHLTSPSWWLKTTANFHDNASSEKKCIIS